MLFLVNVHTDPISALSYTHEGLQQVCYVPLSNNLLYLTIGSMNIHDINETKNENWCDGTAIFISLIGPP